MMQSSKYSFSFTGAGLHLADLRRLACLAKEKGREVIHDRELSEEAIKKGNARTNKRELQELRKRIEVLTDHEISLQCVGDLQEQKQIALLGICKAYDFFKDFVLEVVHEKYVLFDYELTDGDYHTFYNRKLEHHPELDQFSSSTLTKVKARVFHMLTETGILEENTRQILPQILSNRLKETIQADDPAWLKIFPSYDE
jgi:hypothetical protein